MVSFIPLASLSTDYKFLQSLQNMILKKINHTKIYSDIHERHRVLIQTQQVCNISLCLMCDKAPMFQN